MVLLSTTADHLALVTNASPGTITLAQICQFSDLVCGGFEAGASRGYLHVSVANKGTIDASYTLTVRYLFALTLAFLALFEVSNDMTL